MIFCHWHYFLLAFLFDPQTCKHSYHCSIGQKTSIRTQSFSMECFTFPFCTMCFLLFDPSHLLRDDHKMCHLLLRLVVVNMAIVMDAGCSDWCLWPQHFIEWMQRIPFIQLWPFTTGVRIGAQSSDKEHIFWATFSWSQQLDKVLWISVTQLSKMDLYLWAK